MSIDKELIKLRQVLGECAENTALMGIDTPRYNSPSAGFEALPEYQNAVDAVRKYFEAVGKRYDEVILGRKK